ncbi:MAG TPA: thiamine pyrophosphate-dependent enzyme, partial [Bacteroidales bacterium]
DNVISTIKDSEAEAFQPELIISFVGQVVSKMVKSFLRKHPATEHWHVSPSGEEMNTYFCLTETIKQEAEKFFYLMNPLLENRDSNYSETWKIRKEFVSKKRDKYLKTIPYSDLQVFDFLLKNIPEGSNLHLGNSTPVRYSQLFGSSKRFNYFSNRGVSGIDGQVSTTAGAAFISSKINTIITGDLGFLYDSNALMNHYLKPNLKIIVINNGGGGIFRFIDGPASTPQLEKFFEVKHNWKAEKIAGAFDIEYFKVENFEELITVLKTFYSNLKKPALLEIFTPQNINSEILRNYFKMLKNG